MRGPGCTALQVTGVPGLSRMGGIRERLRGKPLNRVAAAEAALVEIGRVLADLRAELGRV